MNFDDLKPDEISFAKGVPNQAEDYKAETVRLNGMY